MTTVAATVKDKILTIFKNASAKSNTAYRKEALEYLQNLEVPHSRMENWKYTRPAFLTKNNYELASEIKNIDISPYLLDATYYHLVFINGLYSEKESVLPAVAKDILLVELKNSDNFFNKNFFTTLNAAYFTAGLNIHIPSGIKLDKPLQIIHLSTHNYIANVHHVITVEKNAKAEILITTHSLSENAFLNIFTEIECKENATLTAHLLQLEESESSQYNYINCRQEQNSVFTINTFSLGKSWIRNDLDIVINGSHCEANLYGAYLPQNNQHIDNHTLVKHLKPHSVSNELYKGVLTHRSTGVFNGKVLVEKNAQKTNAYQSNSNILLSNDATVYSKPELEIYADDVKCSHGSTTGQIDEEALFYLQSRGISKDSAMRLLVQAFVADVTKSLSNQTVKTYVEEYVSDRFMNGYAQ
ncbi:MAG: Fe-S cluster assembly protein SufD [Flavobacteriales bacterium]|nr:Fe-S cluster assembly protein SufD [Flavobacteriales bacterium]